MKQIKNLTKSDPQKAQIQEKTKNKKLLQKLPPWRNNRLFLALSYSLCQV